MLRFAERCPFTEGQKEGMRRLHALLPARVQALEWWVEQVPRREWLWGDHQGWTIEGVMRLKRGEWTQVPGLFMHEHGHAIDQVLRKEEQRARWAAYAAAHPERMTGYHRHDPAEQFAEAVVRIYQRPLPRGYQAADPATVALVRQQVEG
jgi:hypothetical protein